MFIEFVDAFRCLEPHEESWLVLAADRMDERRVIDGTLGCPLCRAAYPIEGGVVWFARSATPAADDHAPASGDEALRLAALLDLAEPQSRALLVGTWGALAERLLDVVPAELLLLDPPATVRPGPGITIVRAGGRVPLAAGSVAAAAIENRGSDVDASIRAVRARGRVVGPLSLAPPPALEELARDDRHWVATRTAPASKPIQLRRV